MSARSLPGFTAEAALGRFIPSGSRRPGRPYATGLRLSSSEDPATQCSGGVPGTTSIEEYLGNYYVCCCPDDFLLPCECTGIV